MKARLEIECQDPEKIIKSLEPDAGSSKFVVGMKGGNRKLYIEVSAKNISALLAGINSCLRLIRMVLEVENGRTKNSAGNPGNPCTGSSDEPAASGNSDPEGKS
ncbi:MAG: hypothetical protein GXO63_02695 [Candidatus Micrarchaeota archaeon]|nr:hypothetical protein [Candidatus Micrarchaeota archaeon]